LDYLALLERRPGAFDAAKPLANWKLPDCFSLLRKRFEAEMGYGTTKEFIKVLRLLERFSLGDLTAAILRTIEIGTTSVEAIALTASITWSEPSNCLAWMGIRIYVGLLSSYRTSPATATCKRSVRDETT
jgi:hypothetical protein